jgi:uncharacterized protein
MDIAPHSRCTAFEGTQCVASGELAQVALKAKGVVDGGKQVLIFDDVTSEAIEVDFRGTAADVLSRLPRSESKETESAPGPDAEAPRGPGRPKLGVVAREVTLLPRHWDWLNAQPGGASVALRKLVEAASRTGEDKDRIRQAQEAAYRFMSVTAGNKPHYEEAIRALFAGDATGFEKLIVEWPADIRGHTSWLAERAFHRPPQAAPPVDPADANR